MVSVKYARGEYVFVKNLPYIFFLTYSSVTFLLRYCFSVPRCFFLLSRFCFDEYGTLVFFRGFCLTSALVISSFSFSIAAFRFASCVRCFCDITRNCPFLSARVWSLVNIRFFCPSFRDGHCATLNSSVTRVLTLLTFCPPGPLLRENCQSNSSSETNIPLPISIIPYFQSIRQFVYNILKSSFI